MTQRIREISVAIFWALMIKILIRYRELHKQNRKDLRRIFQLNFPELINRQLRTLALTSNYFHINEHILSLIIKGEPRIKFKIIISLYYFA